MTPRYVFVFEHFMKLRHERGFVLHNEPQREVVDSLSQVKSEQLCKYLTNETNEGP